MWISVLTWAFEMSAAAAIGAAVTGAGLFLALALLLHSPRDAKQSRQPFYAGEVAAQDTNETAPS
ncbi:MAG: hypothetical protein AB7G04_10760 [Hyphomonadaceae bacterium]